MDAEAAVEPGRQDPERQSREDDRAVVEAAFDWVMEHDGEAMRRLAGS
jgi:hypothetical protein